MWFYHGKILTFLIWRNRALSALFAAWVGHIFVYSWNESKYAYVDKKLGVGYYMLCLKHLFLSEKISPKKQTFNGLEQGIEAVFSPCFFDLG
ncbi:MAG: hypothetical protein CL570_08205 [Alphaproteobacteria bacterium]|nr:hypothetical protein [Alphaproteobacteria bacterium]HCQ70540.1 hypothetical protein [Rhodospirillaceae bacterium]